MFTNSVFKRHCLFTVVLFVFFCSKLSAQVALEDIPLSSEMAFVFNSDKPIVQKMGSAKSWVAKIFGDYKAVLQFEDSDNRQLIIKGNAPLNTRSIVSNGITWTTRYTSHFTMTFDFKDDRYRIKIEDIQVHFSIDVGSKQNVIESDNSVEKHLSFDTSRTENDLAQLRVKMDDLIAKRQMKMKKREREELEAEISRTQEQIDDKMDYIINRAPKNNAEDILSFRTTFCALINSAAKEINYVDDF